MTRIASSLLAFLLCAAGTASAAEQRQRSVILIVIDSLRPDDLQTYGARRATSPELLKFSKSATVFTNAYSNAPWTRPSIHSLITGLYPAELSSNNGGGTPLMDGQSTMGTVLRSWGYTTGFYYNTGQLIRETSNLQDGFDKYVDYGGTRGADLTKAFVKRGVDQTIEFLKDARKPAFLFFHILDPHHPYLPERNVFGSTPATKFTDNWGAVLPQGPWEKGKVVPCNLARDLSVAGQMREVYDSEIVEMDRELGRLFEFIARDKRYSDALVIVTSDHGEEFGEHGGYYHGRMYDETLRIPLIIRDPARPHGKGRRVGTLVSLIDVFPTVLQSLGLSVNNREYSGKSLVPYFTRRGGLPRTTVFFDKPACGYEPINAIRRGDWKMIIYRDAPKIELYDLAKDPREQRDLSESQDPRVRTAFAAILKEYQEWHRHVTRPLASRHGAVAAPLPPQLLERLKALGYIQ